MQWNLIWTRPISVNFVIHYTNTLCRPTVFLVLVRMRFHCMHSEACDGVVLWYIILCRIVLSIIIVPDVPLNTSYLLLLMLPFVPTIENMFCC